jgi:hypothetical protein
METPTSMKLCTGAAMQLHQAKVPSSRNAVHSEVEAFRALHEEGVVVLSTLMEDPKMIPVYLSMSAIEGPFARSHPPGDAKKYAELTGGQSINLHRKKSGDLLAELTDALRARYTIGYRPSARNRLEPSANCTWSLPRMDHFDRTNGSCPRGRGTIGDSGLHRLVPRQC